MGQKRQLDQYLDDDLVRAVCGSAVEADEKLSDHMAGVSTAPFDRRRRTSDYVAKAFGDHKS